MADFKNGDNWTRSGSNIYNANVGAVGVGEKNPTEKLTVSGNILVQGVIRPEVKIVGTDFSTAYGRLAAYVGNYFNTYNAFFDGQDWQRDDTSRGSSNFNIGTGALRLRVARNSTGSIVWSESLFADVSGVGIATTTPIARFHVSGISDKISMQVDSSGVTALFISGNGVVGINTTTPNSLLQVGSGNLDLTVGDGMGGVLTPKALIVNNSGTVALGVGIADGTRNRRAGLFVNDISGLWGLTHTYSSTEGAFVINVAGTERFRIANTTGLIGIGISGPDAQLTVSGGTAGRTIRLHGPATGSADLLVISGNQAFGNGIFPTADFHIQRGQNLFSKFHAVLGSSTLMISRTTSSQESSLVFSDGGVNADWRIGTTPGTNTLRFVSLDGVTRVHMTSGAAAEGTAGRFGLNTTAPAARLHVSGPFDAVSLRVDASGMSNAISVISGGFVGINTASPKAGLHINTGYVIKRVTTLTNYTATGSDYLIGVGSRTSSIVITLPDSLITGSAQVYIIKDEGGVSSAGSIVVDASGAQAVDNLANYTINTNFASVSVYNGGAGSWYIY